MRYSYTAYSVLVQVGVVSINQSIPSSVKCLLRILPVVKLPPYLESFQKGGPARPLGTLVLVGLPFF